MITFTYWKTCKAKEVKYFLFFYFEDGRGRLNDMVPCPVSFLISGMEGKLTKRLCFSEVCRENTFLRLEAWYGGHDHGNAARNLLLWFLTFFVFICQCAWNEHERTFYLQIYLDYVSRVYKCLYTPRYLSDKYLAQIYVGI